MPEKTKTADKSDSHEKTAAEQKAYRKERECALQELDAKLDDLKKKTLDLTAGTR
jgi:hypothetical protein